MTCTSTEGVHRKTAISPSEWSLAAYRGVAGFVQAQYKRGRIPYPVMARLARERNWTERLPVEKPAALISMEAYYDTTKDFGCHERHSMNLQRLESLTGTDISCAFLAPAGSVCRGRQAGSSPLLPRRSARWDTVGKRG